MHIGRTCVLIVAISMATTVWVAISGEADADIVLPLGTWAGYQVYQYKTGTVYGKVEGSWVVPTINDGPCPTDDPGCSSPKEITNIWVGIGFVCNSPPPYTGPYASGCPVPFDDTLIQIGTQLEIEPKYSKAGKFTGYTRTYSIFYQAWTNLLTVPQQLYGAYPKLGKKGVRAGDTVHAGVHCVGKCNTPLQDWQVWINNLTTGESWVSGVFEFPSGMLSAEWIVEAPHGNDFCPVYGYYPLPNFGTVGISATNGANGITPILQTSDVHQYDLQLPGLCGGQMALPSPADGIGNFRVCYGPSHGSIPSCP